MKKILDVRLILLLALMFLLAGFSGTALALTADYVIDDNGGDCASIGIWDGGTKTCTLTTDLMSSGIEDTIILISGNDIVLEGNGKNLFAYPSLFSFIIFDQAAGCTIRDLSFTSYDWLNLGVLLHDSGSNTLENLDFADAMIESVMQFDASSGNTIKGFWSESSWGAMVLIDSNDNTFEDNVFLRASLGVQFLTSTYNTFSNNTIHALLDVAILMDDFSNNNEFYLNSIISDSAGVLGLGVDGVFINNEFITNTPATGLFMYSQFYDALPVGGNYYQIYDSPGEGCTDTDSDNICDSPYSDAAYVYDVFPWVTPTFISDNDIDGFRVGVDCNDNDFSISPRAAEIPYNGIDENCNGMTDDDDVDTDGYGIATDCNDNDPYISPEVAEIPYNGIDENCNGMDDDDDFDSDGYGIATDCNDSNPNINPGATEIPYNGIDENCNGMDDDDDLDSDGYGIATDCNDDDPTINPGAMEIPYNGIDENCNGMDDDTDFDLDGYDYMVDCNDNDPDINPGATETKHDGIDQDCNGYDLTIDIISVDYKSGPDKLTVKATSSYGASANLEIDGYGVPMSWNNKKSQWEGTVQPAGGNPGSVTVTGPEGSESAPVQ